MKESAIGGYMGSGDVYIFGYSYRILKGNTLTESGIYSILIYIKIPSQKVV